MNRFKTLMLVVALAAAALFGMVYSPANAQAQSATINCNDPGVSLQTTIDNANAGADIFVTGTCGDGPFFVGKDLRLIGFDGGATLSAPAGSNHVLSARRASLELHNSHIMANGTQHGILLHGANAYVVGVVVQNAAAAGIRAGVNSELTILESEINNNSVGVLASESSAVFMTNNMVVDSAQGGVVFQYSSSGVIRPGNVFDGNEAGLVVSNNASVLQLGSSVTNNTKLGILVATNGFYATVVGSPNTVENNGTDVRCMFRGILQFNQPLTAELPPGSTNIGRDCKVIGAIY